MTQALDDFAIGKFLQMTARLAQPDAANPDSANLEFLANQMIQRYAPRDHIAPRFRRRYHNLVFLLHGFERLSLDQGQFEIRFRFEEGALFEKVTVTLQTGARDGANLGDCLHSRFRVVRDEDGFDLTVPHSCPYLTILSEAETSAARLPGS